MNSREKRNSTSHRLLVHSAALVLLGVVVFVPVNKADAETGTLLAQVQIGSMRQDSISKMPSASDIPRTPIVEADMPVSDAVVHDQPQPLSPNGVLEAGYDPLGRRDPFAPIIQELQLGVVNENLPPLQRTPMAELNLIAIVWGTYGYTAMVQTPEGHGYTVRRGTKIGQNNGVVSAVTERGIIVQERFTDVYGKKQEREYVKLLHPKEGSE